MGAGNERELPNHGTTVRHIQNTIKSRLHEPCGCGESKESLKRIAKTNHTLNSTEVKSMLYGFDLTAILL